jgi:two-component system, chemotaxis family, sensor kinase CheA
MEQAKSDIEKLALRVVTLDPGDIPAMGEVLNTLSSLEKHAEAIGNASFMDIIKSLKDYAEKLILDQESDIVPVEDAVTMLQEMSRAIEIGEEYKGNSKGLLARLGHEATNEAVSETSPAESASEKPDETAPPMDLTEEDVQILTDFVAESMENLETIEVSLIDLEDNPSDQETINAIFRPFHTIKGVSGFLNLNKINHLSHATENLLDSARQGDFKINDAVVDIILASVDTLKQMVTNVETGLASGDPNIEGDIDIEPMVEKVDAARQLAIEGNVPLGERLVEKGALKDDDLEKSLEKQKAAPNKKIGAILVEEKATESKEVISALRDQKRAGFTADVQVKVDTKKLDNLIDLTGELVISQSMLRGNTHIQSINDQQLTQNFSQLNQIVSSLQKTTMSMRMVPIKSTFQKMVRLVRDLARNTGKKVNLEMSGEDTEIDRNVVDELYEPMVHMIRNSIDHGLESPQERAANGKPEKGTVNLRAYHKGGNIVIEIEDDGKGLNKDRIIEKALASELIENEATMTDSEIFQLIFHPGFSTAKEITDVSGRGVGMDVVKKGIEKLHGRVDVQSKEGVGTTVVISLPLTLAIIDGMLIRVGIERYIIPTMAILESFRPKKEDYFTVKGKGEMVMARGNLIQLLRLDKLFRVKGDSVDPWDGLVVVVENKQEQRGLLLDELLGQEEIVIKSLGEALKRTRGLAGGAILGDGRVGLILDIAGLFDLADKQGLVEGGNKEAPSEVSQESS